MTSPTTFPTMLQAFFAEHLTVHKRVSPRTVTAYRDTFRLLLSYLHEKNGTKPSDLCIADLDAPVILAFLEDLEQKRQNSVRTRNCRLTAIRSFFRFVALRDPESVSIATRVLAIPVKRTERPLVAYLTRSEIQAILDAPDRSTWSGRRDHALFLTFYNTGARLSELTSLKRSQVTFGSSVFVQLHGKGRKKREVPIWRNTSRVLKAWFRELGKVSDDVAFPSARGSQLSSDGVSYILRRAVVSATSKCPSLANKRVTPHVLRHYVFSRTM